MPMIIEGPTLIKPMDAVTAALPGIPNHDILPPETLDFYQRMIRALIESDVPFMVGGAYALARYTGIERHTKDLDVFVRREDVDAALHTLSAVGCTAEWTFPHWLGKAFCGDDFIDVIYSSGNGIAQVDDEWFEHAVDETVLGIPVQLVPPEEMLWSKAFVMERERFDGADINHLLLHMAGDLDWDRLLRRFGDHAPVLLAHLTLFRYAYPSEAHSLPDWVIERLQQIAASPPPELASERVCRGSCLSRQQYLIDINKWGFADGRRPPYGSMSDDEVEHWTKAIGAIP
jgi:hypothetical protein